MRGVILLLMLSLLPFGCAITPDSDDPVDLKASVAEIRAFKDQDLQNALAWAKYNNDKAGEQCWQTIIDLRKKDMEATRPPITGTFSAFEAASSRIESGKPAWLETLNLGCAA